MSNDKALYKSTDTYLAYLLNKFATKRHQARQYLLKDVSIMPCEMQHT